MSIACFEIWPERIEPFAVCFPTQKSCDSLISLIAFASTRSNDGFTSKNFPPFFGPPPSPCFPFLPGGGSAAPISAGDV